MRGETIVTGDRRDRRVEKKGKTRQRQDGKDRRDKRVIEDRRDNDRRKER